MARGLAQENQPGNSSVQNHSENLMQDSNIKTSISQVIQDPASYSFNSFVQQRSRQQPSAANDFSTVVRSIQPGK